MLIHSETNTITVSGETGSANTGNIRGLVRQILVKPDTETTQYDISITNPAGIVVYRRTSETGTLSEPLSMPIRGIYTLAISGATKEEDFLTQLICEE